MRFLSVTSKAALSSNQNSVFSVLNFCGNLLTAYRVFGIFSQIPADLADECSLCSHFPLSVIYVGVKLLNAEGLITTLYSLLITHYYLSIDNFIFACPLIIINRFYEP